MFSGHHLKYFQKIHLDNDCLFFSVEKTVVVPVIISQTLQISTRRSNVFSKTSTVTTTSTTHSKVEEGTSNLKIFICLLQHLHEVSNPGLELRHLSLSENRSTF